MATTLKTKTIAVKLTKGQNKVSSILSGNQGNMKFIESIGVVNYKQDDGVSQIVGSGTTLTTPDVVNWDGDKIASKDVLNSAFLDLKVGSDVIHEKLPIQEIITHQQATGKRYPVGAEIDLSQSDLWVGNKNSFDTGVYILLEIAYLEN